MRSCNANIKYASENVLYWKNYDSSAYFEFKRLLIRFIYFKIKTMQTNFGKFSYKYKNKKLTSCDIKIALAIFDEYSRDLLEYTNLITNNDFSDIITFEKTQFKELLQQLICDIQYSKLELEKTI